MSREGLIFKKFVDKLLLEDNRNNIETYYLPASRKVCSFASIITKNNIKEILDEPMMPSSCNDILKHRFGLNKKDRDIILNNINFDQTILLHKHTHQKELNNLIFHGEDIILKHAKKVRSLLQLYYNKCGIPSKENIYVDIGYRGTMQHLLNKIFVSDIKFKFIYLLVNDKLKSEASKAGYYYFYKYSFNSIIEQNRLFLEYLFMPIHGTLLGFEEKNEKIVPIWEELDDRELKNLKIITFFQIKALKLLIDKNILLRENKEILNNLIIPDNYDSVKQFENFFIEDNFGGLSQRKMIAVPILLNYTKINKVTLFELLMLSEWKEGALFIIKESKVTFKEKNISLRKNTKWTRKLRKFFISPVLFLLDSQFILFKKIGLFLSRYNGNKTIKERFNELTSLK